MNQRRFIEDYRSTNGAIFIPAGSIATMNYDRDLDKHNSDINVDGVLYTLPRSDFVKATMRIEATQDLKIIHAAMCSMVLDNHTCQDNLSDEEWRRAEALFKELDEKLNESRLSVV